MKDKNPTQQQTPLGPPLTGGKTKHASATLRFDRETIKPNCTTPPLSRGGREGFAFVAYNKKLTTLARENRKNPTAAESKLWNQLLRMSNLSGYKFSRQKPIAKYIADFYCAELHLVIEIDGDSHAESLAYDVERTQALNTLGIKVVRYTNDEILKNMPGVYDDLMRNIASLAEKVKK